MSDCQTIPAIDHAVQTMADATRSFDPDIDGMTFRDIADLIRSTQKGCDSLALLLATLTHNLKPNRGDDVEHLDDASGLLSAAVLNVKQASECLSRALGSFVPRPGSPHPAPEI